MNIQRIYEKLNEIGERVAVVEQKQDDAAAKVAKMSAALEEIQANANRLKGAFMLSVVVGGALGWVASTWDKITSFLHGL
jgi:F0F1-type ATP synthase assembly protein I